MYTMPCPSPKTIVLEHQATRNDCVFADTLLHIITKAPWTNHPGHITNWPLHLCTNPIIGTVSVVASTLMRANAVLLRKESLLKLSPMAQADHQILVEISINHG
jgi:hypothetical protein